MPLRDNGLSPVEGLRCKLCLKCELRCSKCVSRVIEEVANGSSRLLSESFPPDSDPPSAISDCVRRASSNHDRRFCCNEATQEAQKKTQIILMGVFWPTFYGQKYLAETHFRRILFGRYIVFAEIHSAECSVGR